MKLILYSIGILAFGSIATAFPIKDGHYGSRECINILEIQTFIDDVCKNEIKAKSELSWLQLTALQKLSDLIDTSELTKEEKESIAKVLPNCKFIQIADIPQKYTPCKPCLPFTFCEPCEGTNGNVVLTDAYVGDDNEGSGYYPEFEQEGILTRPGEIQTPIKPLNPFGIVAGAVNPQINPSNQPQFPPVEPQSPPPPKPSEPFDISPAVPEVPPIPPSQIPPVPVAAPVPEAPPSEVFNPDQPDFPISGPEETNPGAIEFQKSEKPDEVHWQNLNEQNELEETMQKNITNDSKGQEKDLFISTSPGSKDDNNE